MVKLLEPLARHGVSMTRFESRRRASVRGSITSTSTSKVIATMRPWPQRLPNSAKGRPNS
jgi:hypothetical protein